MARLPFNAAHIPLPTTAIPSGTCTTSVTPGHAQRFGGIERKESCAEGRGESDHSGKQARTSPVQLWMHAIIRPEKLPG